MKKKLYVGNLNYNATEEDLRKLFSGVGQVVAVNVITDRETGRSKGFAFVEMETEEDAQEAIERLSNQQFLGRTIRVSEARPPRDRPSGSPRRGRGVPLDARISAAVSPIPIVAPKAREFLALFCFAP